MPKLDQSQLRFVNCTDCLSEIPEGASAQDYARLSLAATPQGDLLLGCNRHNVIVTLIPNKDLAMAFKSLGLQTCTGCGSPGHKHDHSKETVH